MDALRIGRIPYINCYPVYGAVDRGIVSLYGEIVTGVPTILNDAMSKGELHLSVVSAVEYARDADRYILLRDLAISCDGPVQSVMLFSKKPVEELSNSTVLVSKSSMTSVELLKLLFNGLWNAKPSFVAGNAELSDISGFANEEHDARLVIGDAAIKVQFSSSGDTEWASFYPYRYDLGEEWKRWTGLPFVFAVWVAQRTSSMDRIVSIHSALLQSRDWGLANLSVLARQAEETTGIEYQRCLGYLSGLDYGLSNRHLAGLTEFFRRLVSAGRIPDGSLAFLPAA